MLKNNLAIVVTTCNAYRDVIKYFMSIFKTNWPNTSCNMYLITDKFDDVDTGDMEVINTHYEVSWSKRLLFGLNMIKEKYILFLMDDYYIGRKVNEDYINFILEYISANDLNYYDLRNKNYNQKSIIKNKISLIKASKNYPISLQAAIWNKEFLVNFLSKKECSAWEVENYLKEYCDKLSTKFVPKAACDLTNPLNIKNAVIKGKWDPRVINFYKKKGVIINTKGRKKLCVKEIIKQDVFTFFSNIMPKKLRKNVKNILKKIGVKFVTE